MFNDIDSQRTFVITFQSKLTLVKWHDEWDEMRCGLSLSLFGRLQYHYSIATFWGQKLHFHIFKSVLFVHVHSSICMLCAIFGSKTFWRAGEPYFNMLYVAQLVHNETHKRCAVLFSKCSSCCMYRIVALIFLWPVCVSVFLESPPLPRAWWIWEGIH